MLKASKQMQASATCAMMPEYTDSPMPPTFNSAAKNLLYHIRAAIAV